MTKTVTVRPLATFGEISELAVNMPGCKMLLHYVDKTGAASELELNDIASVTLKSEPDKTTKASAKEKQIKTKGGKVVIKGD